MIPVVPNLPTLRKKYCQHKIRQSKAAIIALRNFSFALKTLRKAADLKQAQLAEKVGCSTNMISNIENQINSPSWELYLALCDALGQRKPPMT